MTALHPKYIAGKEGEQLVGLSQNEFDNLIEVLEDQEDVRLFDEANLPETHPGKSVHS
jgi:hypothetical protein